MEEREHPRIMPDLEVCDAEGQKVGTVTHVYERTPGAADSATALATATATPTLAGGTAGSAGSKGVAGDGAFEMKTGFFGLGKHYFVPFGAVKDVTTGGVFLSAMKDDFDAKGWQTKPDFVEHPERMDQAASPARSAEVALPGAPAASPAATSGDWDTVRSHYRMRWTEHYGAGNAQWETYEPRYRFAWEMFERPEYRDRSWIDAQPELRSRWEVLHPDQEWETVADSIRDAWEHPPTTTEATRSTAATGATSAGG